MKFLLLLASLIACSAGATEPQSGITSTTVGVGGYAFSSQVQSQTSHGNLAYGSLSNAFNCPPAQNFDHIRNQAERARTEAVQVREQSNQSEVELQTKLSEAKQRVLAIPAEIDDELINRLILNRTISQDTTEEETEAAGQIGIAQQNELQLNNFRSRMTQLARDTNQDAAVARAALNNELTRQRLGNQADILSHELDQAEGLVVAASVAATQENHNQSLIEFFADLGHATTRYIKDYVVGVGNGMLVVGEGINRSAVLLAQNPALLARIPTAIMNSITSGRLVSDSLEALTRAKMKFDIAMGLGHFTAQERGNALGQLVGESLVIVTAAEVSAPLTAAAQTLATGLLEAEMGTTVREAVLVSLNQTQTFIEQSSLLQAATQEVVATMRALGVTDAATAADVFEIASSQAEGRLLTAEGRSVINEAIPDAHKITTSATDAGFTAGNETRNFFQILKDFIADESGSFNLGEGAEAARRIAESTRQHGLSVNMGSTANKIDKVIVETLQSRGDITSKFKLTSDEALRVGEKWVGPGYREIGKVNSGVFRSLDGKRQFRMENGSITGSHNPNIPHVHLEEIMENGRDIKSNNHIPYGDL